MLSRYLSKIPYLELWLLTVAALVTRLWNLGYPRAVVFDEVYFKVFAGHYFDHRYYFDIHPPLGKLIFAAWAALCHIPTVTLLNPNLPVPTLRIVPALAGALLIPVFWIFLRRLGLRRRFAFLGAFALLADNALLVESRFVLTDTMLLLASLSALTAYLTYRRAERYRWLWLLGAAFATGCAVSIKWTGLATLGSILLLWAWDRLLFADGWQRLLRGAWKSLAVLIVVPLLIYGAVYTVHFGLLTRSGDGDAFMSTGFQSTLIGSEFYTTHARDSYASKLSELTREMYVASETLSATHPYGSRWYTWPLELRPIYFWAGSQQSDGKSGNIYLLGNPAVWWGALVAIVVGVGLMVLRRTPVRRRTVRILLFLSVVYAANLLPFIGVTRVMFLYHYLFAFIVSIALALTIWNELSLAGSGGATTPARSYWYIGATVVIAAGWLYFAPLSYGTPLSPSAFDHRMWLPGWR